MCARCAVRRGVACADVYPAESKDKEQCGGQDGAGVGDGLHRWYPLLISVYIILLATLFVNTFIYSFVEFTKT